MTFDLVFDEASSTSQTSSSSLDLDRIQQFAAMSLKELHEHWDLSCTSSRLSGSQNISESAPNKTKASNEDQDLTTMNVTETFYSTDHIPNSDTSIQLTDYISTTTNLTIPATAIASPLSATAPQLEPVREPQPQPQLQHQSRPAPARVFRQRQPKQLQPFTEDRKQYHFLFSKKERLAALGSRSAVSSKRRTPSPIPQSFSEYDPSYVDRIPSDGEDYDYGNSDGFVDDLDVDNWSDSGDISQPPSMMGILLDNIDDNNHNHNPIGIDTENDDDDEFGQEKRKKRRIVVTDDSDDSLDGADNNLGNRTTATRNSSTRIDNIKRNDYDIFDFPSHENLELQITHKRKSTTKKGLITYERRKKASKPQRHHKTSASQKLDINTTANISPSKPVSSPPPRNHYDVFDIESLNNQHDRQINSIQDNMDNDSSGSSDTLLVRDGFGSENLGQVIEISTPTLPTTPRSSATSIRQTNHGSVRKKAYSGDGDGDDGDDDDDGFIVDDDDYGHGRRRRNTTLREVRKNKRHLKGILPTSYTMIYNKQLEEEENYKRLRPSNIPTKRKSSQDIDRHNDPTDTTATAMNNANNHGSDYLEIEMTVLDDDDMTTSPQRDFRSTSASGSRAFYQSENPNATMDSQRYEEEQRNRRNLNIPMDCGVPFLRNDAASVSKLAFMDDEQFTLFSLHQDTPLPTDVLDQPFADSDYYVHSPAITYLFELAYESFYTMWDNFKNNDIGETGKNTSSGLHEKNMSLLLGFLRFVSICISKGFQNNKNETDAGGDNGDGSDKAVFVPEMQQFLIGEMDNLVDRILDLVNWKDDGVEMSWLKSDETNQRFTSPLLLVFVYFVEWSYQIHMAFLANPLDITYTSTSSHWTLKASLRRLLWYLLSLGPSSVSVEPITSLLFDVSEPRVMEAWVLVLQLIKLENMDDTTLWPCLQDFLELTEKPSFLEKVGNTGDDTAVWNKVEVTWKWVLALVSLQRIQKDDSGFGKVKTAEFNCNSGCWGAIQQLLREILQQKTAIGNLSMTEKTLLQQFRPLTLIRLTFYRCHLLLTKYNWMWDSKTLQYLYDLAHIPQLQVFTGDPIHPQKYQQQQDKATAAKYFPHYFTSYDGTIPDDEISPMDTCGIIFLKTLSHGLQKRVNMILKSSNNNDGNNIGAPDNEQRENLQTCLARVTPAYLVAGDVSSGKSPSFLLYNLVSNPASSLNQDQKVDPLVSFSYDYSINMAILHATAPLGKKDNIGLEVLRCNFEFHARLETEKACAIEITWEAHRIYENIKKKWGLD